MVYAVHEPTQRVSSHISVDFYVFLLTRTFSINLVVYYMPTVLVDSVGLSTNTAQLIAGFVELMFPVGNLLPAFFLDRLGRRPTMIYGCAGLSFCMVMITILLSIGSKATSSAAIGFFFLVCYHPTRLS